MIYNAENPQIVSNTTGFGRRKRSTRRSRFGGLYSQMGPASEIGNQYLIAKDTGNQLYSGERQNETPRPYSVQNEQLYIGQAPDYNPIGAVSSFSRFGKKLKENKAGKLCKKVMSGKDSVNIKISIKGKNSNGKKN
jgi:hypothetical protein